MATPKVWRPRKTEMLKRLTRCVDSVGCTWCRYAAPGNPLSLPVGWLLFEDGTLVCDRCQREAMTGVLEPVRTW